MRHNLVDVFRDHVSSRGERVAYRFSNGREIVSTHSFGDMDVAARRIAAGLHQRCRARDRVLLLADEGADFVQAFLGCLYAGVIAVPLSLPVRGRGLGKLRSVATDASARLVLTDRAGAEAIGDHALDLPAVSIQALHDGADEADFVPVNLTSDDVAFLQYTSGSTGAPKGVIVSHGNLLANEQMIHRSCAHDHDSLFVGWLPLFHDMGLVGNILQPAYAGIPSVLMPPRTFIRRPLRWLELISTYRATTSGGPNFAYDTCVRRIDDAQLEGLDLRSWRIAFNGAEPIRARTMAAFARKFERAGFGHRAFYPVYGLAEATLMVTANDAGNPPRLRRVPAGALERGTIPVGDADVAAESGVRELVGCGPPREGQRVRIVHPEDHSELGERQVGEIWVAGPNVSSGYWNNAELTRLTMGATTAEGEGPFLRTGDLGFLDDGQLYVTGRSKDLLIVNGANHYPQDLEQTAAACEEVFAGRQSAVFALHVGGRDEVVVLQEVPRTWLARRTEEERAKVVGEVKARIRQAIQLEHGFSPRSVLLVQQGSLPLTTSGKIQRSRCRELFSQGQLAEIWTAGDEPAGRPPEATGRHVESAPAKRWTQGARSS